MALIHAAARGKPSVLGPACRSPLAASRTAQGLAGQWSASTSWPTTAGSGRAGTSETPTSGLLGGHPPLRHWPAWPRRGSWQGDTRRRRLGGRHGQRTWSCQRAAGASACQRRRWCAGPSATASPVWAMYETAHARTHGVEEEYLSLKGAMGNARLSGRAVGHDGRSVLSCRRERIVCVDWIVRKKVPFGAVFEFGTTRSFQSNFRNRIGKDFQSPLSISKYFVSCLCTVD